MENTITIAIEGDASGLTSQLKNAGRSITNFISQMNSQEVNWTKILSESISPAIIAGIASTFAIAITQAVQFQNAMTQTANTSTTAFANNSAAATQAALAISSSSGQSASDVANAMGVATRMLGNYADAQALVATASQFSLTTGMPLVGLTTQLSTVMQQWGITGEKITPTIIDLFGAAAQGKVNIQDLLTTMGDTGPMLQGKTSIDAAAASLEAFSNQTGNTSVSAIKVFQQVADAAFGDVTVQANLSALGAGNMSKAVQDGGMANALANLEQGFGKLGVSSQIILGANAGFSDTVVANLSKASKSYSSIAKDAKTIQDLEGSIGSGIEKNLSAVNQLQKDWETIKNDLGILAGGLITKVVGGLASALQGATGTGTVKGSDFISALGENLFKVLSLGTGDASTFKNIGNIFSGGLPTTPAGTNTSTVNNITNYNISPKAVGADKGSISNGQGALHAATYGIGQ